MPSASGESSVSHHNSVKSVESWIHRPHWLEGFSRALAHHVDPQSHEKPIISKLLSHFTYTQLDVLTHDVKMQALGDARETVQRRQIGATLTRPWEDDRGNRIWNSFRTTLGQVVLSKRFETFMSCVILCNVVFIVYETNLEAVCYPVYKNQLRECPEYLGKNIVSKVFDISFIAIYSAEALLKIYIERRSYFRQNVNVLDFIICLTGILAVVLDTLGNISWLRILRFARLLRIFDVVANVPELHMLCVGFVGSMRAILFGTLMMLGILGLSAILLVQYIHPVSSAIQFGDCPRCSRGFASVQSAILTLYQNIVTGDSWGTISIPIIEDEPVLGLSLCAVQLVVGVGAMNLILAVVVNRAMEAREANKDHAMHEKLKDQTGRKIALLKKIAALDVDSSGTVNKEEMRRGIAEDGNKFYEMHRALILADVTEEDLERAFDLLDKDGDGEISYLQLCEVLDQFQAADVRKLVVLTRLHISKIESRLAHQDRMLESISVTLNKLIPTETIRRIIETHDPTIPSATSLSNSCVTHSCSGLTEEAPPDTSCNLKDGICVEAFTERPDSAFVQSFMQSWEAELLDIERIAIDLYQRTLCSHATKSELARKADDVASTSNESLHVRLGRLREESKHAFRELSRILNGAIRDPGVAHVPPSLPASAFLVSAWAEPNAEPAYCPFLGGDIITQKGKKRNAGFAQPCFAATDVHKNTDGETSIVSW